MGFTLIGFQYVLDNYWFSGPLTFLITTLFAWGILGESSSIRRVRDGLASICFLIGTICFVLFLISLEIQNAVLLTLVVFPILFFIGMLMFGLFGDIFVTSKKREKLEPWVLAGASTILSLLVTLLSIFAGHLSEKTALVPQTLQMIFSNIFFDGTTMLMTFWILGAAVDPNRVFPIPFAIILDLLIAAILACGSLWFGLVGTDYALSLNEILNVLVGFAPEGTRFSTGPYFWLMHTTFIPTVIFLSVVLFCWLGKLLVVPIFSILKRGKELENPHVYTASTLGFIMVILVALATGFGYLKDMAPDSKALGETQKIEQAL